jgi:hypothetical protein
MIGKTRVTFTILLVAASVLASVFVAACGDEGGEMAILDVEPRQGGLIGDQAVQIKGVNFRPDIGYRVYFGNRKATSVTVIDPETLLVVTPERQEVGPVDITVLADNGPAFSVSGGFAYVDVSEAAAAAQKNKGNLAY